MLMDTQAGSWVYRRCPGIGGPMASMGRRTRAGLPYLAPEIQLLFKAREETLTKDQADFDRVAPHLPRPAARWLLSSLRAQFPDGHPWAEALAGTKGTVDA